MFFLLIETIIQVTLPELHVTWLCVTLLSVLYFIYCSEMWNQLDALTGLLNQNSYLNRTAEMRRRAGCWWCSMWATSSRSTTATATCRGDICLAEIGRCIKKSLCPQRLLLLNTGGDEFCVLMENADQEAQCAQEFVRQLEQRRRGLSAHGVLWFSSLFGEDVLAVKNRADREMCRYKRRKPDAAHCSPNHYPPEKGLLQDPLCGGPPVLAGHGAQWRDLNWLFGFPVLVTRPLYKSVQTRLDRVLGLTRENLTGVRVVRAFDKEKSEVDRFEDANELLTQMQLHVGHISALMNPLTYVIINLAIVALLYVGSIEINISGMASGDVIALVNYT